MPKTLGSRDVQKRLEKEGFVLKRQAGSHMFFQHADGRAVVALAGRRDLPTGTLRSIFRQANWKWPPK
jgi:predicted RNA binding protein YcfA (HicA-like mRNA interferase family)